MKNSEEEKFRKLAETGLDFSRLDYFSLRNVIHDITGDDTLKFNSRSEMLIFVNFASGQQKNDNPKVGFDLHGVLTESPHVFKNVLAGMRYLGHEIHIISGPPENEIRQELLDLGYEQGKHYDIIFSMVDYLRNETDVVMTYSWNKKQDKISWWCDDELWWPIKGDYCRRENIDILFDDKNEYREHISEDTQFFKVPHNSGSVDKK